MYIVKTWFLIRLTMVWGTAYATPGIVCLGLRSEYVLSSLTKIGISEASRKWNESWTKIYEEMQVFGWRISEVKPIRGNSPNPLIELRIKY
jgi:hypothetical protein